MLKVRDRSRCGYNRYPPFWRGKAFVTRHTNLFKSGTFGVPIGGKPGCETFRIKSGLSRQNRDGWTVWHIPNQAEAILSWLDQKGVALGTHMRIQTECA